MAVDLVDWSQFWPKYAEKAWMIDDFLDPVLTTIPTFW